MKKLISIICLFALSIQVLPLRDIGRILFNQQINEELPHSCTTAKDSDIKFDSDKIECWPGNLQEGLLSTVTESFIRFSTLLPKNYHGEIHNPPPNFL